MAKYKYILTVIFILCTLITYAQPAQYTPMTASGYQMKRLKVDSTLHLPSFCGVPTLRGSTVKDGALAIDTCGGYLYMWTNQLGWDTINVTTTGGGGNQDLQSVLNNGNTSYNRDINLLGRTSGNQIYISPLDNNWMPFMALGDSIGGGLYQYTYPQATIEFINKNMPQKLKGQDSTRAIIYLPTQTIDATDTLAKLSDVRDVNGDFWKTTGTTTTTGNVTIINSNGIISFAGGEEDIATFSVTSNDINLGPVSGNLTFSNIQSLTDTSTYKPLMISSGGIVKQSTSWVSGGSTIDTTNQFVKRLTRTPGKDSIIYFIGGTRYAIKDSVGGSGTVTSVGLTMPSAFTVSNSPVTGSGTIGVTGSGTVSQYVRGNGTLADFPTSTGGGASVSYYLNGSVSQGTIGGNAYKQINAVPVIGAGTDFTINANGYIAQFITDVADPNKLSIPAGNWNFETYFSASSGGGSPSFYIELYKYDGTTFTLIASNSATPENITGGTNIDLYFTALAVPSTTLLATDRLAVRFFVTHSGRTITMHTEDNHLSQIITTFSTGLTALNGLTAQVQNFSTGTSGTDFAISSASSTHTFNLPTASATNRGALSTSDWSTFNGKLGASDTVSLSNRINLKLNIVDTSALQRKSIPAYTILANKTPATANATAQTFRDTSGVYDGSITWTATTAPSGATNHSYRLTQIGKFVTLNISLVYATNGNSTSAILLTLPSNAPTPAQPTGLTGANQYIYVLNCQLATSANLMASTAQTRGMMRNNSANNGVELFASWVGSSIAQVNLTIQYWTN